MAENKLQVEQNSLLVHRMEIPGSSELERGDGMYEMIPSRIMRSYASIMIWAANTYITPLHEHRHTEEEVEYMNKYGLHIFLYEPLCSYYDGDPDAAFGPFNCGFYSEYPNTNPAPELNGAAELDSISVYCHNNHLTNVTIHTGDYDVENQYPRYTNQMKLLCNDPFLRGLSVYDHIDQGYKTRENLTKRFISANWRFTPARCIISALLCKRDTHLGWFYTIDPELLKKVKWMDFGEIKQTNPEFLDDLTKGLDYLNNTSPYCLDLKTEETNTVKELFGHFYPKVPGYENHNNPVAYNPVRLTLQDYYKQSFVDVVNESRFAQPTANISEKVIQAVQYKTPFLLVAPQHSLKYMKEFGYKSFDKWWDESYDQCESHFERILKIYEIIKWLDTLSYDELFNMYEEMKPVLDHNFDIAISNTPIKRLRKLSEVKWDELKETQWAADSLGVSNLENLDTSELDKS